MSPLPVFRSALLCGLLLAPRLLAPGAARAFDPAEDRPVRITGETLGGLLGGAGGVFTGGMLATAFCGIGGGDHGEWGCLSAGIIGGLVGGAAGIGLGVWGAGELAGANGGVGWTYLGTAAGAALAAGTVALGDIGSGDIGWYFIVIGLPLVGSIIAYELSTEPTPAPVTGALVFSF